ncbi:hypothetical protein F5144DRAFT_148954 [Chaetomium tenue]|uniref:Uncharacterized protein n=1 Tax=Chaetomium tenue TaxID=1854479 RepID=A0ACB7PIZ9_9PEZI|nr:hypothetical protein F5144DRAFT_148954 [Chaetomium globosum]
MANVYPPETDEDGVVTSWVPLTTTFTPSVGCESKFRLNGMSLVAYDPGYGLDIDSRVKCQPPAVTTWWEQGRLGRGNDEGHTAASIGPLKCPNAWGTVAMSVNGISTHAMCCPPEYTLANGEFGSIAGDCRSEISSGAVFTFASTSGGNPDSWTIATTTLTRASPVGAIAVVGWNIARETTSTTRTSSAASNTDPNPTSSSATSTSLSELGVANPTTGLAGAGSSGSSSPETSSGLPTGAAIGIGVGVGLGVVGVAALFATLYLIRYRKRKAEAAAAAAAASVTQPADNGYLPPPPPKPAEAYGPHEMLPEHVRYKMPVPQPYYRPYELP